MRAEIASFPDGRYTFEDCLEDDGIENKEYIQNKLHKTSKGAIVNTRGQRLGTHDGIEFYTIGQRRGLGIELKDNPDGTTGWSVRV